MDREEFLAASGSHNVRESVKFDHFWILGLGSPHIRIQISGHRRSQCNAEEFREIIGAPGGRRNSASYPSPWHRCTVDVLRSAVAGAVCIEYRVVAVRVNDLGKTGANDPGVR